MTIGADPETVVKREGWQKTAVASSRLAKQRLHSRAVSGDDIPDPTVMLRGSQDHQQ